MKRASPVTLSPAAFARIRYALTRQLTWLTAPDCPYTLTPKARELYTRTTHARALLDAARTPNQSPPATP